MGHPSTWDTGWAEAFAAMLIASLTGKALGSETRLLTLALIGAVITDDWTGIAVAVFVALITKMFEVVRSMS